MLELLAIPIPFKKPSGAAVSIGLVTTAIICLAVVLLRRLFPGVPEEKRIRIATLIGLLTVVALMILQGVFHIF